MNAKNPTKSTHTKRSLPFDRHFRNELMNETGAQTDVTRTLRKKIVLLTIVNRLLNSIFFVRKSSKTEK